MKKKFIALLTLGVLTLSSCSLFNDDSKVKLASNIETFLFSKLNYYREINVEEINNHLSINVGFAIYFTEEGCGACQNFSPIIDKYIEETDIQIYKVDTSKDKEQLNVLKENYRELLFKDERITTPSVCVVHDNKADYVNYDSYMKTESAFTNYMKRTYSVKKFYVTSGNVFDQPFYHREFALITFDFNNQDFKNRYTTKLKYLAYKSDNIVIVSNYIDSLFPEGINLRLCGKDYYGYVYDKINYIVTDATSEKTIKQVL